MLHCTAPAMWAGHVQLFINTTLCGGASNNKLESVVGLQLFSRDSNDDTVISMMVELTKELTSSR